MSRIVDCETYWRNRSKMVYTEESTTREKDANGYLNRGARLIKIFGKPSFRKTFVIWPSFQKALTLLKDDTQYSFLMGFT